MRGGPVAPGHEGSVALRCRGRVRPSMPSRSRGATEKARRRRRAGPACRCQARRARLLLRQYRHGLDAGEGSPGGRPKGARNLPESDRRGVQAGGNGQGGGPAEVKRPAVSVLTRVMIAKAIQSDSMTGLALLGVAIQLELLEPPANDDTLQPEDAAILEDLVRCRQRKEKSDGD